MNSEAEVSVKDIVNFYIKINDASKAKKDLAQLSAKDKLGAFEIVSSSSASQDFKIEVAKYFMYDLDGRVRKKAEVMLENLIPGWVSDPAESILKLLQSADHKGTARRNAAVKFLFGIVDATSLRDTFMSLLSSRNRAHLLEIITILEDYIDKSSDEKEQVKIFDACLDIVLSDDTDSLMKHHAATLLSVFFKKVQSTDLGETLRRKYIEKQVDKAEAVYRFLCSNTAGLNLTMIEDLLRPLSQGGIAYQRKILNYFIYVLDSVKDPEKIDTVLDTYPDYWNQDEPPKEQKVKSICHRIVTAVDELWEQVQEPELREMIIRIKYGEYVNKRELFEKIKVELENENLNSISKEKLGLLLHCFLLPDAEESLKLLAVHLLLFKIGDAPSQMAALSYLRKYVETKMLNYAEKESIAKVLSSLIANDSCGSKEADIARYALFIIDPASSLTEESQKLLMSFLRKTIEGNGFDSKEAEHRVLRSLQSFAKNNAVTEKLKKAALYLEFKMRNPNETATWDKVTKD